jgi:glycosyltransferase involved in cell wall biosynthesis
MEDIARQNVTAIPSGHISQSDLHRLFATARIIVFPSFYEGFGLPVAQGLAYGRPVLVRDSPLWYEIADRVRMPGQLVIFDKFASLVEVVGRSLAHLPLQALPLGGGLHGKEEPLRWRDCARTITDLAEELMLRAEVKRWQERDDALQAIRHLGS